MPEYAFRYKAKCAVGRNHFLVLALRAASGAGQCGDLGKRPKTLLQCRARALHEGSWGASPAPRTGHCPGCKDYCSRRCRARCSPTDRRSLGRYSTAQKEDGVQRKLFGAMATEDGARCKPTGPNRRLCVSPAVRCAGGAAWVKRYVGKCISKRARATE